MDRAVSAYNDVTDNRGARLLAFVPAQAQVGEAVTLTLVATLPSGRVDFHYGGELELRCTDPHAEGPGTVHAIAVSGGAHKHTLRFRTPGVHRLTVTDLARGLKGRSNPIVVHADEPERKLYWGDLHVHVGERFRHRGISDAYAPIDYNYHFGRHVAALDFMALSAHDGLGDWRPGITPIWDRFKRAAAYHHRPGEFVTLLGWEWTNGEKITAGRPQYGQKCIYYRGDDGPLFPSDDSASDTPAKLYDRLRAHDCFVIPHHVAAPSNFYNDWDHHDPTLERLVEIHSIWGCGERSAAAGNPYPIRPSHGGDRPGHHVMDALARGYTLGFTGGGDIHDAAPGIGHLHNGLIGAFEQDRWRIGPLYHPGLQGVWADQLDRPALFDAIMQRRTFATTGARILVETELAGRPMGHVFPLRPRGPWSFSARVIGTECLSSCQIVHNGEVVHAVQPDREQVRIEHTLSPTPGRAWIYLRLTQADGHMAWSSPHFIPG